MSYEDGWAAINLEMPPRVPRTEYSVETYHFELIGAVTGMNVGSDSPPAEQREATRRFMEAWGYDLSWATDIGGGEFGELKTDMGHAEYAADGSDRRDTLHCPFETPEQVLDFDPVAALGTRPHEELVSFFEERYAAHRAAHPDCVNMTGIYVTCISGLIDLFGWEMLLLAAGVDPQRFGELTDRYCRWAQHYFDALADADVPVVMVHDDIVWTSGPFIHPDWYRRYVFPNYRRQFAPLVAAGKRILFTSDGNYTQFIDDIAECGVDGFVMEPATDMAYVAENYGDTHVFVGNADTRVLLSGSRSAIRAEVERCMDIGKGCPGFFMAVGNHIPANTPVDACLYYNEVYEELSSRG
ncbi:MAG: uroporphyrinogen decarboxylase family protein [Candidatus Brocadiia bacterium]